MSSLATFRLLCGDLAYVDDDDVTSMLAIAAARMNVSEWDATLYPYGACYLAGHMFQAQEKHGAVGNLIAERTGDLSKAYSAGGVLGRPGLQSTAYGQEYLALMRQCGIGEEFVTYGSVDVTSTSVEE
jgi:hypothetical protein